MVSNPPWLLIPVFVVQGAFASIGSQPLLPTDPRAPAIAGIMITDKDENVLSLCSGSLVAPQVVLTAAHCVDDKAVEEIYVVFAAKPFDYLFAASSEAKKLNLAKDEAKKRFPQIYKSRKFTIHPDYPGELCDANGCDMRKIETNLKSDLALLLLDRPAPQKHLQIWDPSHPTPLDTIEMLSAGPDYADPDFAEEHMRRWRLGSMTMKRLFSLEKTAALFKAPFPNATVAAVLEINYAQFRYTHGAYFFTEYESHQMGVPGDSGSPAMLTQRNVIVGVGSISPPFNGVRAFAGFVSLVPESIRQWLSQEIKNLETSTKN